MSYEGADFNLDTDYKPEPLIGAGVYEGVVQKVTLEAEKNCITWAIKLQGNEGNCVVKNADGLYDETSTPIDGRLVFAKNWLPKAEDKDIVGKGGTTKFQSKVNMLSKFATGMKVSLNSPAEIQKSIENLEFTNKEVNVTVAVNEFPKDSGQFNNEVKKCTAR